MMAMFAKGQQYLGMEGLIHIPTADMDSACTVRIGAQYMPKEMIPDAMTCDNRKFNSCSNYLSITPFKWVSIGYGYTLWKLHKNLDPANKTGFYSKDRYFSVKLQPISEARWWPSVVVGGNDVWGTYDDGKSSSSYFRNFHVAVSKHVDLKGWTLGGHLAYRYWYRGYNKKWNGVVGGVTVQCPYYKPLRAMAEWDGHEVNLGLDCRVFKFVMIQCALIDCKHFTGGVGLYINLM